MTPAEKRIKELIDRWLTSIELHLQYVELSDEAYAEIQAWPPHDRPTRWVLELAKQKVTELKTTFETRRQMGDSRFAEALELMTFLANLVGAQHVDRFVPLAEPQPESEIPKPMPRVVASKPASSDVPQWYAKAHAVQTPTPPVTPPKPQQAAPPSPPKLEPAVEKTHPTMRTLDPDATREMPKVIPRQPAVPVLETPKSEIKKPSGQKPASNTGNKATAKNAPVELGEMQKTIVADAVRLMSWGKPWHELAELIARMADRPPLAEVRKTLRAHRATIEKTSKETAKQ